MNSVNSLRFILCKLTSLFGRCDSLVLVFSFLAKVKKNQNCKHLAGYIYNSSVINF